MSDYNPDRWVVVRIDHPEETICKVLGGWIGGYLGQNSWRLNSGIAEVQDFGDFLLFVGYSGSVYHCHKSSYGLTVLTASVLAKLETEAVQQGVPFTLLEENADFVRLVG